MRFFTLGFVLISGAAQAESLCGATDQVALLEAIHGPWSVSGSISVETQTLSVVEPIQANVLIGRTGAILLDFEGESGSSLILGAAEDALDVDQVDNFLKTVEAEWIADEVSDTPCGPEGLLQLQALRDDPEGDYNRVTVLPYFDDRLVIITEIETAGEWGLAFITLGGILTPEHE